MAFSQQDNGSRTNKLQRPHAPAVLYLPQREAEQRQQQEAPQRAAHDDPRWDSVVSLLSYLQHYLQISKIRNRINHGPFRRVAQMKVQFGKNESDGSLCVGKSSTYFP